MKLIVGLGNPGLRYKNTRHNIGFLAVDNLKPLQRPFPRRFHPEESRLLAGRRGIWKDVVLFKPQGFMNNSGPAVKRVIGKLNIDLRDVLVVCDDINLGLGIIRLRAGGSAGGHKGLQSIIDALGTSDFNRLRIGIGADKGAILRDYVLSKFRAGERKTLKEVLDMAAEAINVWIEDGIETAMNKFNRKNPDVIASEPRRGKSRSCERSEAGSNLQRLLRQPPSAASSQ